MAEPSLRCLVFDLDDTLFLERDYVRSGFDAVGAWARVQLGMGDFATRAWAAFEAGVRKSVFNAVLAEADIEAPPGAVAEMVAVYRNHTPAIGPLPDAVACLEALHGLMPFAVVTDGPLASQRGKAAALNVRSWSAVTVFTAELGEGYGKPDRRSFQLVEQSTGAAGDQCLYLADNPRKDFGGPRSLGWRTIRVRRRGSMHEHVASGPDVDTEVADLWGLPALVRP